jgi:hypothetical protein
MRFIHSADWQIGKVFKQFGAKEESLRQARLTAIERLGAHAKKNGVGHILVAGDVYDSESPNPHTLRAPIERIKSFADVHWHLLPGNHDPHRPEGVWDRVAQLGLPANIHLHLAPTPFALENHAFLLPAPLVRKSELDDISARMDGAATPPGALRIGLAHGSVVNFGKGGEAANPIGAPGAPSMRSTASSGAILPTASAVRAATACSRARKTIWSIGARWKSTASPNSARWSSSLQNWPSGGSVTARSPIRRQWRR